MKLILSSCDFGNDISRKVIYENLPKAFKECKVLFIPTGIITTEITERLCSLSFTEENIIIFNHKEPEKFKELDIDLIYVGGGNTFSLLHKIRESGFDKVIINYVKSGVVYAGGSAGAHIVTKNVEHVKRYDENNVGLEDFSGLGLFDGILMCHYTAQRREHLNELEKQNKYKIQYLTDSDSIIVTDSESVIITAHGSFVMD